MRKFTTHGVSEYGIAAPLPPIQKDAINPEADLADVDSRLTNPNTDGKMKHLANRIAQVCRTIVAPSTGVSTLTQAERRAMRDKIVEGVMSELLNSPFPNSESEPTPAIIALANLLAGLTDELEAPNEKFVSKSSDPGMQEIRQRIARLKELVEKAVLNV